MRGSAETHCRNESSHHSGSRWRPRKYARPESSHSGGAPRASVGTGASPGCCSGNTDDDSLGDGRSALGSVPPNACRGDTTAGDGDCRTPPLRRHSATAAHCVCGRQLRIRGRIGRPARSARQRGGCAVSAGAWRDRRRGVAADGEGGGDGDGGFAPLPPGFRLSRRRILRSSAAGVARFKGSLGVHSCGTMSVTRA